MRALICVQFSRVTLPMDSRVRQRLLLLVRSGVTRCADLRQNLQQFVETELFDGRPIPPRTDARFWPTDIAIRNAMYRDIASIKFVKACIYT